MQNVNDQTLYPPVQYHIKWLVFGIILFLVVVAWYGFVFWFTRLKKQRTIANLAPRVAVKPDINALKTKYLGLINEVEQNFAGGSIKARYVHQKLSILLRYFVYEAQGYNAQVMTLTDLKRSRFTTISSAIESYYPPEFMEVEHGNVPAAIAKSREVVQSWK